MLRATAAAVHLSTVGKTVSRYSSKRQYVLASTVVGLASFSRTGTNGRKHGLMGAECASVPFPRKMKQLPVKLGSGGTSSNNYSSAAQIPSHEQVSVPTPSRQSLIILFHVIGTDFKILMRGFNYIYKEYTYELA